MLQAVQAQYGLAGPYFLYVGTLQPRKNLARLVEAFAKLLESSDQASSSKLQLVLAGQKGWLADDLLGQVRKLGLGERVVLTGYVPDADLPALLSGALAFVFPSLYEGFGLPVLEAMACGTPVVCSNTSSLPEVAGMPRCMVDPLDTEALAEALSRIAEDRNCATRWLSEALPGSRIFPGSVVRSRFWVSWRMWAVDSIEILGTRLDDATYEDVLALVDAFVASGKPTRSSPSTQRWS